MKKERILSNVANGKIIELSKDNDKYVRQEIARYCPNKRALELLSKDTLAFLRHQSEVILWYFILHLLN